jgi:hypothetical protein
MAGSGGMDGDAPAGFVNAAAGFSNWKILTGRDQFVAQPEVAIERWFCGCERSTDDQSSMWLGMALKRG